MPKQKREKEEEENYISDIRYLNRLRLKQDSLVIALSEKELVNHCTTMDVFILMSLYEYSLKTSLRGYELFVNEDKLKKEFS